ncbi:MAG: hypothetical protein ACE5G7_00145 [Candidatus Hydrothermarchaeaceae archaeon]
MVTDEQLRKAICSKCEFYKEDEELECYAFKLNKKLIEEGKIRLDDLNAS